MSWVTVIWLMSASACLTLGAVYWLVWYRDRAAWAHLLFSVTAASTAAFAFCELWLMRAQTPEALADSMKWAPLPFFFWLVSLTWFVGTYLGTGRRWLAWTITGMRLVFVLLHFLVGQLNYLELPTPGQIRFLGESVTVLRGGTTSPVTLFGQFAVLLIIVFVADAGITAWRRGDRRRALTVAGSVEFFLFAGLGTTSLVVWLHVEAPIMNSLLYMGLVAAMGYELSRDVLRASQLVRELQASEVGLRESEARMSLAIDAADVGIWIRDLARNEIWASEKWRELFGFAPTEPLEFNAILRRLHPDDREGFVQALTMASAGGGRYQVEYRLLMPDGETRWISSMGRVEVEATGQPVLMRGASRDVTVRKHAEIAVRHLSGRLLSAQEAERRRIARELHDNLSQRVALLAIEIEQVGMKSEPLSDVAGSMRQLGMRTAEISTEIHNLSHQLHSAKLEALGLEVAVQGHCRELRAQGLQVQCLAEKVPDALPYEVALCLFRVVQEGLNNVVKHSGAREVRVQLTGTGDALLLTIADAGRGFDEATATGQRGLGLASMRERLHSINGELTLRSHPGHGATIIARVPITEVGSNIADTVQVA
jgi:PAS domain S-box-containing protein